MIAGLLQCDHVASQFAGIAGDYDRMFRDWLPELAWRVYDLPAGQFPSSATECDLWVSTGSRHSVYDDIAWIHDFAALVREVHAAGRPFLGMCFGHQMMAHALGGRTAKNPGGWCAGMHDFRVVTREAWMQPPLEKLAVLMSCQDQVLDLPPGAVLLATSEQCPAAMFRCGNMLGIQGHPEWSSAYARALLEVRRERIGPERADAALHSLMRAANSRELAEWVLRWANQKA